MLIRFPLIIDKPQKPKSELPGAIVFWGCILILILAWGLAQN